MEWKREVLSWRIWKESSKWQLSWNWLFKSTPSVRSLPTYPGRHWEGQVGKWKISKLKNQKGRHGMKEDIIVMTDLKGKFKMTTFIKLTFQVDTLSHTQSHHPGWHWEDQVGWRKVKNEIFHLTSRKRLGKWFSYWGKANLKREMKNSKMKKK